MFDTTLAQGKLRLGVLVAYMRLTLPLLIASIEDEVTGNDSSVTRLVVGAREDGEGGIMVLRDWELLKELNVLDRSDVNAGLAHRIVEAMPASPRHATASSSNAGSNRGMSSCRAAC
jgi:hypothetical protein